MTTMNSNERERLKLMPERMFIERDDNGNFNTCPQGFHDAEYVRADLFDIGAGIRIKRGAKNKRKLERDAATRMRDQCVAKVRAAKYYERGEGLEDEDPHSDDIPDYMRAAIDARLEQAATALESLTLDVEQKS